MLAVIVSLTVAGCSASGGDATPTDAPFTRPGTAFSATTGSTAESRSGTQATTGSPEPTPTGSPSDPARSPLTSAEAHAAAVRLLGQASTSIAAGPAGAASRAATFTGAALKSAGALAKQWPVLTPTERTAAQLTPGSARIMAISAADSPTRYAVVQATRASDGQPAFVLLTSSLPTSTEAGSDLAIAAVALVFQPGTTVDVPASWANSGPPNLAADALATDPQTVLTQWAASTAYPKPAAAPALAGDAFRDAVTAALSGQAKAIGENGTFTAQTVAGAPLLVLPLGPGDGALVFGTATRTEKTVLTKDVTLTASPASAALDGFKVVTKDATSLVAQVVVVHIPQSGAATVVAASEQRISATGH